MGVTGIMAGIVAPLPFTTPKYEVREVIARLESQPRVDSIRSLIGDEKLLTGRNICKKRQSFCRIYLVKQKTVLSLQCNSILIQQNYAHRA